MTPSAHSIAVSSARGGSRRPTSTPTSTPRAEQQLTIKRAIEELGDKAIDANEKEIGQLYARGTFARANVHDMTAAIRWTIISSSCFLREKFNAEGLFD
jgi:hypothetical protein